MQSGIISKLNREKEYGCIRTESGEEVHFHKLCLWDVEFRDLIEDQEVEFELQPSHKGWLAFHIRLSKQNMFL